MERAQASGTSAVLKIKPIMKKLGQTITFAVALGIIGANAKQVAYFPMDVSSDQITEKVSGLKYDVNAANEAENISAVKGYGLRLDGYSNYVAAYINCGELSAMTFSVWCAMETWPIIEHDVQNETDMTMIAGNYDAAAKRGFGFFVSRVGKLSFKYYSGGWPMEVTSPTALPLYKWNNLVAVADGTKLYFYNNGELLGSSNCRGLDASGTFMIGKDMADRQLGPFLTNTLNGIIDEIEIYDEALSPEVIKGWKADNEPMLNIVSDAMGADLLRPGFHAMPSRNWTNETHGLVRYGDKYHIFFQKNANGPYMSRLQWGHLVSEDLCTWEELPIAIGSDRWYDLKGCWSGCVAVDDVVTGGKPNIIYTGVDYARAMIAQAAPLDDDLLAWTKPSEPIINGRPAGLSDDFRDPFFFRDGDGAYIIVGTSKDGKGACTLHKYNPAARSWSNDGSIFYQANSAAAQGTFWEMPNLTKMGDKWLFTVTPQGLSSGVKVMYWTGDVESDGTFRTSAWPDNVELPGFAKEGYGLLSPSIMQVDGKTVAIGIVPDKLASEHNYDLGWAHTYSLPREWSLDDRGRLLQRPWSGLAAMRDAAMYTNADMVLSGEFPLGASEKRMAEVVGEFVAGDSEFGFNFFKNGADKASLSYNPATGMLTVDFTRLTRISNDANVFDGVYTSKIPTAPAKGETMKIQLFIDRSIIDVFINDKYASSIRVFPTGADADGIEAFAAGDTQVKTLNAWTLKGGAHAGINDVILDEDILRRTFVDVFTVTGVQVKSQAPRREASEGLAPGIYIIDGNKMIVR